MSNQAEAREREIDKTFEVVKDFFDDESLAMDISIRLVDKGFGSAERFEIEEYAFKRKRWIKPIDYKK